MAQEVRFLDRVACPTAQQLSGLGECDFRLSKALLNPEDGPQIPPSPSVKVLDALEPVALRIEKSHDPNRLSRARFRFGGLPLAKTQGFLQERLN